MEFIKIVVVSVCLGLLAPAVSSGQSFSASVSGVDPEPGTKLAAYEKLYLRLSYESESPVRFQVVPLRKEMLRDFGFMESNSQLLPPGKRDALMWISYSSVSHIDKIRVTVLDAEWNKIGQFDYEIDVSWSGEQVENQREPAEWVKSLLRKNRLRQELVFDPTPDRGEKAKDVFFYMSIVSIPFYLILQVQFLRLWRGRWRDMAAIPLISLVPLLIAPLLGMGMDLRLWVIFIFRGTTLVLIYLCVLWLVKQLKEKNLDA